MARRTRIQTPGLIRHVMARGNGRMQIFLDDTDYAKFLYVLGEVVQDLDIECRNYCLMPNHYHATLKPNQANLSEALRRLNGEYALWWNKRHQRVGHVFQGRFKAQIVQCDEYYLTVCRYIELNPVRARLVDHPEDWPWSSYRCAVGLRPADPFLCLAPTLQYFGEDRVPELQARFRDFVLNGPQPGRIYDRIRSNERVLGDHAFKNSILTMTRPVADQSVATI